MHKYATKVETGHTIEDVYIDGYLCDIDIDVESFCYPEDPGDWTTPPSGPEFDIGTNYTLAKIHAYNEDTGEQIEFNGSLDGIGAIIEQWIAEHESDIIEDIQNLPYPTEEDYL